MNEFDLKAPTWDKNQLHIERSEAIAGALRDMIPLGKSMRALEYGAGTGLLSFLLKDNFPQITLMDNANEMINVIRGKINVQGIRNMKPVMIDLEHENFTGEFEIIYSQMVFHHVENTDIILKKFHDLLTPEGYLAIADLYPEDGSFHGEGFSGHNGFDPEALSMQLTRNNFRDIRHRYCFTIRKVSEQGEIRQYPVFLLIANK